MKYLQYIYFTFLRFIIVLFNFFGENFPKQNSFFFKLAHIIKISLLNGVILPKRFLYFMFRLCHQRNIRFSWVKPNSKIILCSYWEFYWFLYPFFVIFYFIDANHHHLDNIKIKMLTFYWIQIKISSNNQTSLSAITHPNL